MIVSKIITAEEINLNISVLKNTVVASASSLSKISIILKTDSVVVTSAVKKINIVMGD